MKFTDEQRRAIAADNNVIVSAAAGAGKTAVLTERVLRLVLEGTPIDRMLILTFTRAAAGEMKSRIALRLEQAAAESDNAQQRAYLRAQAQLCSAANISTMHAFCSKIVFRHFFRVGLTPSARMLDEAESAVLQRAVRETVLTDLAAVQPETYRLLIGAFGSEEALCGALQKLYAFLCAEPDPDAWLGRTAATLNDREAFSALLKEELSSDRNELSLALSELQQALDVLPPAAERAASILSGMLSHGRGALLQTERGAYLSALESIDLASRLSFPKDLTPEDTAVIKEAKSAFTKIMREHIERYAQSEEALFSTQREGGAVIVALFDLYRAFRTAYAEEKRQRAGLDFDDLEHMTIEILKDDRISAEYRERFRFIIVDEYQDSNRVQEAILSRIARSDNLFFVGDVKQSIYRFRKAEPRLFLEKCRTFTGDRGTRIDLTQNFRSSDAVIHVVNRVFETILHEPVAGIEYDDAARLRRGSSETGGAVECHIFEKQSDAEEESIEDAEAEARFAAQKILERKEQPIYDAKTGSWRAATFGDFAVLLRSKTHAEIWAQTMAYAGIPCYAQLSGGYFDAIEVQLMLNLLRVLDNRRQDIPLLSVLRSPFFGFTDEELIALRLHTKKGSLLDCLNAVRETDLHVKSTLSQLDEWRVLSRRVPMEELVTVLSDATHFSERMGALPGGTQRMMNLQALTGRARAFDATGSGGIAGFLRFMDDAEQAADLGASQTVTANVVRIMTIHKSKGLEFPVVFLAGLGKQFNRSDENEPLLLHEQYGVGLQFLDGAGTKRRTYARRLIRRAIADASWQEELRVLYVGMTRAKSELYLSGCIAKAESALNKLPDPTLSTIRNSNHFLRLLMLSLNGCMPLNIHYKSEVEGVWTVQQIPPVPSPDPEELKMLNERLSWRYPYAAPNDRQAKTSVTALEKDEQLSFNDPLFGSPESATAFGTRVHTILERLRKVPTDEELDALCAAVGGIPAAHRNAIRWFSETHLFARLNRAARSEREWSFVRPVPAAQLYGTDDPSFVLLQGVIDACFVEDGAWVLLDYKTDRVETDPIVHAERHRSQVTLYAEALAALTHLPVREAYVVLLNAHAAIPMLS